MGFLGIDAGQHRHRNVGHLQPQAVLHGPPLRPAPSRHARLVSRAPGANCARPIEYPAIPHTLAFRPLAAVPPAHVEALLDTAFGPDRHARTAYRLREGTAAVPDFSFALADADGLLGTVQTWPVEIAGDDGRTVPLLLLGPIAIHPRRQQGGLGRALTAHALAAIDAAGAPASVLIGDPEYYGRFFGYTADATAGWRLPGPVERRRLLARLTGGPGLPLSGVLRARLTAPA